MAFSAATILRNRNISFGLVIILIQLFLYINADVAFGAVNGPVAQQIILVYILMITFVMAALRQGLPGLNEGSKGLSLFALFFFITYGISLLVVGGGVLPTGTVAAVSGLETAGGIGLALSYGLLHGFVKAYIEESVFRDLLALKAHMGGALSSLFFGVFHASLASRNANALIAKGLLTQAMFWPYVIQVFALLAALGYIWFLIRQRTGSLLASTGSHFAWNAVILGVRL